MKYREQRGGLAESMQTMREFNTREEFFAHLHRQWDKYGLLDEFDEVEVRPYAWDQRIGWDTYVVTVRGKGVGFTDGPLPSYV